MTIGIVSRVWKLGGEKKGKMAKKLDTERRKETGMLSDNTVI